MATALIFREDVYLGLEFGVRSNGTGLGQNLTAVHILLLQTAEQDTSVVAGLTLIKRLVEHLDTSDGSLGGVLDTNDLDFLAYLNDTALDLTSDHGTASFDGEDVFYRHQKRLVEFTNRVWEVRVHSVGELDDLIGPRTGLLIESFETGALDDRGVLVEAVLSKKLAELLLDEHEHLLILDHVALVKEDDDLRHAHLLREKHVFAGLRHGAIGGGHDENRAVHLGGTGDHVLDVVSVTRSVDVRVVALRGPVFAVRERDGNTARLFLRSLVDILDGLDVSAVLATLGVEHV